MADISSIKMPNGSIYDLKDKNAQTKINVSGILEGDGQGGISESDILDYDTDTTSGSVVSFTADGVAPLKSLTLAIDPVQDLHGYDSPWPAGGRINLLDISIASPLSASYGLTKSIDSNGFVHLDGTVDSTGAALNIAVIKAGDSQIDALTGKNYVISMTDVSGGTIGSTWGLRDIDNGSIACSVTNPGNGTEMHMKFRVVVATTKQTIFSPYSNECPITGWTEANLWRTGGNMLDDSIKTITGSRLLIDATTTNEFPTFLKEGTYSITVRGVSKTFGYLMKHGVGAIKTIISGSNVGTFTVDNDGYYRIDLYGDNAISGNVTGVMLELGSTPTAYTPYTGNQYTIQLGQTVYGGTRDVTNGVLRVDYRLLNAADVTWRKSGDVVYYAPSDLYTTVSADTPTGRKPLLCNTFSYYSGSSMRDGDIGYGGINNNGNITIRSSVAASTLEDWNDYIANNTVQIVYPLATPLTYTLTPQQLDTLAGQNVVWGDCGDVTVEYRKGENALLQDISEAIKNLQGKIRVSGLLKGDGNGNVTAAINGTDYSKVIIRDWSVT